MTKECRPADAIARMRMQRELQTRKTANAHGEENRKSAAQCSAKRR